MSVQTETSKVQYAGNNSTVTPYPVPFYFFDDGDLRVVVKDADGEETVLTPMTDYTVSGAGDEDGGEVVTADAYDNTHTVTIYRELAVTQLTEYEQNGSFPATSHEKALDKLTMLVQQFGRAISRCFRVTEASPSPVEVAAGNVTNAVLGYDGDGTPTNLSAAQLLAILEIEQQAPLSEKPTTFWNDDGSRALKVPEFTGQMGVQLDDATIWRSTGLDAGDWEEHGHKAGVITEAHLAANAVTTGKIADGDVTTAKLEDGCVTTGKIADGDVTAAKLDSNCVTNTKIADGNVTLEKLGTNAKRLFIKFTDTQSSGVAPQQLAANTWNVRNLNTPGGDEFGLSAALGFNPLSSNQVTLPPGKYEAQVIAPCYQGNATNNSRHQVRLYNVTGSATLVLGDVVTAAGGNTNCSIAHGLFELLVQSVVRVDHYTNRQSTGQALSSGAGEVYTQLLLWKIG